MCAWNESFEGTCTCNPMLQARRLQEEGTNLDFEIEKDETFNEDSDGKTMMPQCSWQNRYEMLLTVCYHNGVNNAL